MIIKLIWPECEFQNANRTSGPLDSYWVECTIPEAEDKVFPFIGEAQIKKSYQIADDNLAEKDKIYFLISEDLKSIQPFAWYYPYSGMWNSGCPFKEINEVEITNLDEIKNCNILIS